MNKCPNCGSNVNQGESYCRACGTKVNSPQNNNESQNNQMQPVTNNDSNNYNQPNMGGSMPNYGQPQNNGFTNNGDLSNDDYLIDAYIGKNASKLKDGSFSFCTFFLGFFYVLYRKMWVLGAVWYVVSLAISAIPGWVGLIISLAISLVVCFQFKKWYLKNVREQVQKIVNENPGKTREELMMICSQKGGTTLVPVIIAVILFAIIYVLIFSLVAGIIASSGS